MRALSEMSLDQLEVVEMFWGIAPLVVDKVKKLEVEFVVVLLVEYRDNVLYFSSNFSEKEYNFCSFCF